MLPESTKKLCLPTILIFILAIPSASTAEVPPLINYQGAISLAADTLQSGVLSLAFSIYPDSSSGVLLWMEQHQVEMDGGRFHVLLGSVTPFPTGLFTTDPLYLGVQLSGGEEMVPRQRIVSVPFAIQALEAQDVSKQDIHPRSVALSGETVFLDSTGVVSAKTLRADSLAIGGIGVVDGSGNWVGPPTGGAATGLRVDTLIVRTVVDTIRLIAGGGWRRVDEFETFLITSRDGLVEITFSGSITAFGGAETRLTLELVSPRTALENIGNISGIATDGERGFRASGVHNHAVVKLDAGFYRVFVESRVDASSAKLRTGILTIRVYSR